MIWLKLLTVASVLAFFITDEMARKQKYRDSERFNLLRNSNSIIMIALFIAFAVAANE